MSENHPWKRDETPEEALARSKQVLAAVQAQTPDVARLGAALRRHNGNNHYGARLAETMRRASR